MAYEVSIRRDDGEISYEEWRAYAKQSGDFRCEAIQEITNPKTGAVMTLEGPFEVWTKHPKGNEWWLLHTQGRISASRPDELTIQRMCKAAAALGARVQGEAGEYYGETEPEPPAPPKRRRLFRRT